MRITGAIKVFDATAAAGVKRFIIVSAVDIRDRVTKPEPEWSVHTKRLLQREENLADLDRYNDEDKQRGQKMWDAIGTYCEAKLAADRDLVTQNDRRKLDYTIVRPGSLSTDPGSGTVAAGKVHITRNISREDVAEVIVRCIEEPSTIGLAFDIVGGETPIRDAVREVGSKRIDTFEGRY